MRLVGALLVALIVAGGTAVAEPRAMVAMATSGEPAAGSKVVATAPSLPPRPRRNAIYVEILGKGGIWGLGYERRLGRMVGVGGVGSFNILDGERLYSLTPYVSAFPLRHGGHALFVDGGLQLVRISRPSPIPEWDDTHENGIGAELSAGYEYRGRVLLRLYAQAVAGKRGLAPWTGASVGWTL